MFRKGPSAEVPGLTPVRQNALAHLMEAYQTALEANRPKLEYACQLPCLQAEGITETVLRWLVGQGFAEHQLEITGSDQERCFRPAPNLRFTSTSCFLITPAGEVVAEAMVEAGLRLDQAHSGSNAVPHYDASLRLLRLYGQIVKKFKTPAENQELILLAFEEEHWPLQLADPLPGKSEIDSKRRLNQTIKNLNAHQIAPLIRFHGDGTGTGICWEKLPWIS